MQALYKDRIFAYHILKKSCLYEIYIVLLGTLPRFIQLVYIKYFFLLRIKDFTT